MAMFKASQPFYMVWPAEHLHKCGLCMDLVLVLCVNERQHDTQ